MPNAEEIQNPRRILAVSLEDATPQLSRVVKDLTGSAPEPASTSLAGTTHDLHLSTPYYTATVPTWLDLIVSPSDWAASFLSEEAGEVLAVLGGLVLVFRVTGPDAGAAAAAATRDVIRHVGRVVKDGLGGWEWDGVALAVGVGEGDAEEWDELCAEAGLEFVQVTGRDEGRNEFGEKKGIPRVREALEANDWAQGDDMAALSDDFGEFERGPDDKEADKDLDPESLNFGYDRADFEGLRKAIWSSGQEQGDLDLDESAADGKNKSKEEKKTGQEQGKEADDDDDVAKVQQMMSKLQAAREAGESMAPEQRRRMAARAVAEVMKEL